MDLRFEGGRTRRAVTSVITAHYSYDTKPTGQTGNHLRKIIVAAVPNGLLKERYSPNRQKTVFGVGKHSSGRGEDPRVRIYYATLRDFAMWRVQEIRFDDQGRDEFRWVDVQPDGQPQNVPVAVEARLKSPTEGVSAMAQAAAPESPPPPLAPPGSGGPAPR
jgi:Type II restriction enzyme SfiI